VIERALLAMAAFALLGAAPSPTALVQRYVGALSDGRYADAFALLSDGERAYFRSAENFASAFTAGGWRIVSYRFAGARAKVIFVREDVRYRDWARDRDAAATLTAGYAVVGAPGALRIDDPGKPWRAFAARAEQSAQNVRVRVKKVSFFARRIEVVLTVANLGDAFVTLLPYGRGVLRDDAGGVYRPIATRDWTLTDRQLFLGLRLAPNAQYTGQLSFATERLDDRSRRFTLTVAPVVRDGAQEPFAIEVANIAP
jgi:hypothetical protein